MTQGTGRPAAMLLTAAAIWLAPGPLYAGVNGYVQESLGLTTDDGSVIYHRQTVNVKVEETFSKLVLIRAEADAWHDDPDFMESQVHSRLREGYVRLRFDNADVRLGRVQIAWGEADGVIVSDQVTPFDFENFITPGFDEIRKGVDGIFADYYFPHELDLQLLWISHFEAPNFPNPDSPWYPIDLTSFDQPGFTVQMQPFTKPPKTFENSEFGARLSGHPTAIDWAIGYLRSWNDTPTLHIRSAGQPGLFLAVPEHDQFDLFTTNLVLPVRSVLVRFDAAYEHNRYLQLEPPDNIDLSDSRVVAAFNDEFVYPQEVLRALIGLDAKPSIPYWEQADASFQFVHEQVFEPHPFLAVADHTDLVSVRLSAAYFHEMLKPWIFVIANVRGADTWAQAKLDYEPWDAWRFTLEYDLFVGHAFDGDNGGIYGAYDDNDMVKGSVRFSF